MASPVTKDSYVDNWYSNKKGFVEVCYKSKKAFINKYFDWLDQIQYKCYTYFKVVVISPLFFKFHWKEEINDNIKN